MAAFAAVLLGRGNHIVDFQRPKLKLYYATNTRAARIYWLLEELSLDYELVRDDLKIGQGVHQQDVPGGKFPAIEDGDVVMNESGAIIEYILDRYGQGRLAPARTSPDWRIFLQWLHYGEGTAFPILRALLDHKVRLPEDQRVASIVERETGRAHGILDHVNKALAGKDYLLGPNFTAADIQLGSTIYMAHHLGVTDDYRNIQTWLNRLLQRPAVQKVMG